MDITRDWVYQRWARKSTGLADPELFGVRVPLVTGTAVTDLAGSLSYYFDQYGQVQHISFHGRTGDPSMLVGLLVNRYHFQKQPSPISGDQLYQVRVGDRVQSELRMRPEAVMWSTSPHTSYEVELELQRPGSDRPLRPRHDEKPLLASDGAAAAPPKPIPVGPLPMIQQFNNSVHSIVSASSPPAQGAGPAAAGASVDSAISQGPQNISWRRWPD
jgi:hypothetical protein